MKEYTIKILGTGTIENLFESITNYIRDIGDERVYEDDIIIVELNEIRP